MSKKEKAVLIKELQEKATIKMDKWGKRYTKKGLTIEEVKKIMNDSVTFIFDVSATS